MTQTLIELVKTYVAAWNETDRDRRMSLLAKAWADDGVYEDANIKVVGRTELSNYIGAFQQKTDNAKLSLIGAPLTHHDYVFFSWKMVIGSQGASTEQTGYDFGTLDKKGMFVRIVGFL